MPQAPAVRAWHALLFVIGCGVPIAGTGLQESLWHALPTEAQAILADDDYEPDTCRAEKPGQLRETRRHRDAPIRNLANGRSTGAWQVDGHVRPDGSFYTTMTDRNPTKPGSLFVQLHNEGGHTVDLAVRAFGSELSYTEDFDDPAWRGATTAQRTRRMREALMRYARLADGLCGGQISSLKDEIASFDTAFRVFDRRKP